VSSANNVSKYLPYEEIVYSRRGAFIRLVGFIALFLISVFVLQLLQAGKILKVFVPYVGYYVICLQELITLSLCFATIGAVLGKSYFISFLKGVGFADKRAAIETASGFVAGVIFISTAFAVLYLLNAFTVSDFNWSANLLPQLVLFFVAAIVEELVFRAFIFTTAEKGWGTIAGVLVSSLLFGFAHMFNNVSNATQSDKVYSCLLLSFDAGLPLVGAFLLTRRIWFAVGMHWAWNVLEGPVFGFIVSGINFGPSLMKSKMTGNLALSGGAFGPEASLPLFVFGTSVGCALLFYSWKRGKFASQERLVPFHRENRLS